MANLTDYLSYVPFNTPQDGRGNQGFQEGDYNQSWKKNFELEHISLDRRLEEARRIAEREERDREARRIQTEERQVHIDWAGLIGGNRVDTLSKSKKETLIERFAVKFCFFQQRLMSIQTNLVLGKVSDVSDKLRAIALTMPVPMLLKKIFEATLKEAERNGISKSEIHDAIVVKLSKTSESEICSDFVKHYLGYVAVNVFKTNPDVIKDVKPKVSTSTTRPKTIDVTLELDHDVMLDRLRIMLENAKRAPNYNLDIQDYPDDVIQYRGVNNSIDIGSESWSQFMRTLYSTR